MDVSIEQAAPTLGGKLESSGCVSKEFRAAAIRVCDTFNKNVNIFSRNISEHMLTAKSIFKRGGPKRDYSDGQVSIPGLVAR
eukprot:1089429-Prorocentrum_minimum.AAC.4